MTLNPILPDLSSGQVGSSDCFGVRMVPTNPRPVTLAVSITLFLVGIPSTEGKRVREKQENITINPPSYRTILLPTHDER